MNRIFLLLGLFFFSAVTATAQEEVSGKKDSLTTPLKPIDTVKRQRVDTLKPKYVNLGKIAGRKAVLSSLMLPGLGQIRNGVTVYRLVKVAGIYTGATLLTLSYIDNTKNYKLFLDEIIFRSDPKNEGKVSGFPYPQLDNAGLINSKDLFRRNKEIIIFSFVGLYLGSAIEAYIDARLKYFNVDDVAVKISPTMIPTNMMYGFNPVTPGVKFSFNF